MNEGWRGLFNKDWKFLLGDPCGAEKENYLTAVGSASICPTTGLPASPLTRGRMGPGPGGHTGILLLKSTGWYRKESLGDGRRGCFVYFGCAYRNAVIYVNGQKAYARAYGSFELRIAPLCQTGKKSYRGAAGEHGGHIPDRW
jgi:hypothetical protein